MFTSIMAAYCSNLSKLGLLSVILIVLLHNASSQSTTPNGILDNTTLFNDTALDNDTVSTNDSSTPTTTIIPSTTTPIPTTTIQLPTGTPSPIPGGTDISLCPCDLTGNFCDINCCCDPDCNAEDIAVFQCLPNSNLNTVDDKQCFSKDIFLFENGPATSQETDDGLFCIYFDNEESRNFYQTPSVITSELQLQEYTKRYGKFSFQSEAPPLFVADFKEYYASGDLMYVVYPNQAFSYLGLPSPTTATPECVDSNAAAYLEDKNYHCTRIFNLSNECSSRPDLQASTFYQGFRIVKDPYFLKAFNTSMPPDEFGEFDMTGITDLYDNKYTLPIQLHPIDPLQCILQGIQGPCGFSTPPAPAFNGIACTNVLTEVHYTFQVAGDQGVVNAYVRFVFQDLPDTGTTTSLQQTYTATFTAVNTSVLPTDVAPRSGNPGYVVGLPVLAGILNQTTTNGGSEYMEMTTLGLIRPSATGDCISAAGATREIVKFGEDMRTGCFIQFDLNQPKDTCKLLQQEIISALEGFTANITSTPINAYSRTNLYLATFGNSNPSKTGDWVRVLYKDRPAPPLTSSESLCTLSMGMNIQILYANIGSLANPQPKIVGAAFVYDQPQVLNYICSGPYCQPGSSSLQQTVEISSSVTFIDVSQLPENVEGVYPTFAVRLPFDFFYPFYQSDSSRVNSSLWAVLLMCVLSIIHIQRL